MGPAVVTRAVRVFVPSSSTARRGAALHRDAEGGGRAGGGGGVVERERGTRTATGRGGVRGPAEDPTLLTPAFLHLLLATPVVAAVIVTVAVRAARKFPSSPNSERVPRCRVARLKNPRSPESRRWLAFKDISPSAPRVDNSPSLSLSLTLSRARPAEFCLPSLSPPSSLFLVPDLVLVSVRRIRRSPIISFSPPRISLMIHTRCQPLEAAASNVTNATTMTGVRRFSLLLREERAYFCVV